jgi:Sec-independent protein translocase protein TatA
LCNLTCCCRIQAYLRGLGCTLKGTKRKASSDNNDNDDLEQEESQSGTAKSSSKFLITRSAYLVAPITFPKSRKGFQT